MGGRDEGIAGAYAFIRMILNLKGASGFCELSIKVGSYSECTSTKLRLIIIILIILYCTSKIGK